MTQSPSLDYRILFYHPSEIYNQPTRDEFGNRLFVRAADKPVSEIKRKKKILGPDNIGLIDLMYFRPRTKRVRKWIPSEMEDEYDRPKSSKEFIIVPKRKRKSRIECLREKELRKFLQSETKSKRQNYKEYMSSPQWSFFRTAIIKERGSMCERCGKTGNGPLNVHHLTYARLGNELPEDVKVYCIGCHKLMHPGWD